MLDTIGDSRMVNGQSFPLFVSEPKLLFLELNLENTVIFDKIVNDSLLTAVKPAGQRDGQKLEGMYDVRHY